MREAMGGFVLIAIGVVFLLQNAFDVSLERWWALFILIPAAYSFERALSCWRKGDRGWTWSLVGGVNLLVVAGIFLLDLPWSRVWPVFLIVVGLGVALDQRRRESGSRP